jgi:hypothetical protein
MPCSIRDLRRRSLGSGQEMVLRLPSYSQAIKWARLERKSYKIPQPDIEPLISEPEIEPLSRLDHDEGLPLFLRKPKQLSRQG